MAKTRFNCRVFYGTHSESLTSHFSHLSTDNCHQQLLSPSHFSNTFLFLRGFSRVKNNFGLNFLQKCLLFLFVLRQTVAAQNLITLLSKENDLIHIPQNSAAHNQEFQKNHDIPSTNSHRLLLAKKPCPLNQTVLNQTNQCFVSPKKIQIRLQFPLKNVDRSFLALDSNGNPGDFSWPRSIQLNLKIQSNFIDFSQYFYLFNPDFMFFEWLPSKHDNEFPLFNEPVFIGFNFSSEKLGSSIVLLNFLFPESVVLLRSTFRFKLKQLKHNFSDQNLFFDPEAKHDVIFACEKTSSENCLAAIPPYSPFCTTPKNVSTSLVEKRGWEALIQLKLDNLPLDYPLFPNPQLQYAVLYGPCSAQLQTFGYQLFVKQRKDRCQLLLDSIWKKLICATPFKNCESTRVIQIPQIYLSSKYGILVCSFHKNVEFPHNQTMLQQLALAQIVELPINLMQNTSNQLKHDGEMRTFLAYGSILLILFGLLLITLIQKRRQRKPLGANMLQFLKADEWELEESDVMIHFVHKIGNGSTAEVYRGKLSKDFKTPANGPVVLNSEFLVAVKILKKNANEYQKSEFSSEIEINKIIGRHDRIVNLIGVMQLRRPPLIVFEYCPNGDLRRFLHKSRQYSWELESKGYFLSEMDDVHAILQVNEEFIFTLKRLVRLAIQICLGMEFLASRELIHADLATRNVFLTAKNSIKIGDFGMSRKISDLSKFQNSAILTDNRARWAAPEILQQDFQCLGSDVWSFGVVLYELITLGAIPYHHICNSVDLVKLLNDGERIKQTNYCPNELYSTMKSCWTISAENRPNFSDLTNQLTKFYDSVDAKDNKANFYVMPDPDRTLYTLPLAKKDSPPNFIISQTQSTFGFGDSNPTTPKPSASQFSFRGLNKHLGVRNVPSNDVSVPKSGSETKVELIYETERLLGFS